MAWLERTRRFIGNSNGNFAVIAALAAFPIFMSIGAAVDYTRSLQVRNSAQETIDAAVLAGATEYIETESKSKARRTVQDFFNSLCRQDIPCNMLSDDANLQIRIAKDDYVEASLTGAIETTFLGVFGASQIEIPVGARAHVGPPTDPIEVNIVVDVSGSMNIANGNAEIRKLMNYFDPYAVGYSCGFACHTGTPGDGADVTTGLTGVQLAAANGVELRENVALSIVRNEFPRLLQNPPDGKTFAISLFELENNTIRISDPTTSLSQFRRDITKLRPRSAGTHYAAALDDLLQDLSTQRARGGNQIIVLITDGIDHEGRAPKDRTSPVPIRQDACNALKKNDHEIIVLNLAYPNPLQLTDMVQPPDQAAYAIRSDARRNLAKCASKGLYFEADYGRSLDRAFRKIVADIGDLGVPITRLLN